MTLCFATLDELIHQDPGARGVAAYRSQGKYLGEGHLESAARSLATSARAVAIVTGFAVHDGQRYVAETDGPPGALAIADVLLKHGVDVALISDAIGLPALRVGCDAMSLSPRLLEFPFDDQSGHSPSRSDAWVDAFLLGELGCRLTHVVSIERVGPSHTLASLETQRREGPPPQEAFETEVPEEHRDVCHNMRGVPIDDRTAKTHRLFEIVADRKLPITTIGIGDGGNELGMGHFPWEVLRSAIAQGPAGRVVCRIATEMTIVAGVSNWGGYALAAAIDGLRDSNHFRKAWSALREQELLTNLVDQAECVDGVTRAHQATVDGLSVESARGFWESLRTSF